jgi:hypothetical protein
MNLATAAGGEMWANCTRGEPFYAIQINRNVLCEDAILGFCYGTGHAYTTPTPAKNYIFVAEHNSEMPCGLHVMYYDVV